MGLREDGWLDASDSGGTCVQMRPAPKEAIATRVPDLSGLSGADLFGAQDPALDEVSHTAADEVAESNTPVALAGSQS